MVCERWCDKAVCERRRVTELSVKCVTKWCVKDGVSKMVGDKVVCERWCVTKLRVKDGV